MWCIILLKILRISNQVLRYVLSTTWRLLILGQGPLLVSYRNLAQEPNNILFIDPTNNCPAICPAPCPADQRCPGTSTANGCPMPDTCIPITFGENGKACPVACPVTCPPSQKVCEGGFDAYGCRMPNTCIPDHGNFLSRSYCLLILFNCQHCSKQI